MDGSQHYEEVNMYKDPERTAFLEGYGLGILRIPNNEVSGNFRGVCEYIDDACKQSPSQLSGFAQGSLSSVDTYCKNPTYDRNHRSD